MFEEYLRDSLQFYLIAEQAAKEGNETEARRFYRAAVFCTSSAVEAFVNYIADAFAKADTLPRHEIAFLNDKAVYFSADKCETVERTEFHRLDDKLRVLIGRFVNGFDFSGGAWSNLMNFKKFRDSLIHPRQVEDETPIADYRKRIRTGMSGIVDIMNCISKGIYKKPLRKQILDLVPD